MKMHWVGLASNETLQKKISVKISETVIEIIQNKMWP